MGNIFPNEFFKCERLIDNKYQVYVGIVKQSGINSLLLQGIQIGSNNIRRLVKFTRTITPVIKSIKYEFESDTFLCFVNIDDNIFMHFRGSGIMVTRSIDYDFIRTNFKPIIFINENNKICEFELNNIYDFVRHLGTKTKLLSLTKFSNNFEIARDHCIG